MIRDITQNIVFVGNALHQFFVAFSVKYQQLHSCFLVLSVCFVKIKNNPDHLYDFVVLDVHVDLKISQTAAVMSGVTRTANVKLLSVKTKQTVYASDWNETL